MKTVIEMAREAAAKHGHTFKNVPEQATLEFIEAFADLIRADEREACAKLCDARYMGDNNREDMEAKRCAVTIRARGDK